MNLDLIVSNILNPPILFFFLGMLAVAVKSDLEIPAPIPKLFSLYLSMALVEAVDPAKQLRLARFLRDRESRIVAAAQTPKTPRNETILSPRHRHCQIMI